MWKTRDLARVFPHNIEKNLFLLMYNLSEMLKSLKLKILNILSKKYQIYFLKYMGNFFNTICSKGIHMALNITNPAPEIVKIFGKV